MKELLNNILLHFYTVQNGQFITLPTQNYVLLNINFSGLLLFILVNLGLIAFLLTFVLPKKLTLYISMLIFCYQGYQFWGVRAVLKLNQLFPFGVRFKVEEMAYKPNVDYGLFFNALNYNFIIITVVLTILCLCYVINMKNNLLIVRIICIINYFSLHVFLVDDFLLFFFFLECSVFPMVYLIYFYGPRLERNKAALIYFYFSILASFLLFIGIGIVYCYFKSTAVDKLFINYLFQDYSLILKFKNSPYNEVAFFLIFFGLAIKLPIFPFHIWLPEAHGEANTVGSVFLAGTYLKMALYGIVNYCIPLFNYEIHKYQDFIYIFCVSGIVYCGITLLKSVDLKKFIAYTSVIHMNFILIALINSSGLSMLGGIFSAVVHSYVTSMLFFLVGAIYDRTHSRNILVFNMYRNDKSMKYLFKLLTLFLMVNASAPIGPTFVGELQIFLSLISTNLYLAVVIFLGVAVTNIAHFLLINRLYGNKNLITSTIINSKFKDYTYDINVPEWIIVVTLSYFIFRYFLFPSYYIYPIEAYLDIIVECGQYHDVLNKDSYIAIINSYATNVITNTNLNQLNPELLKYLTLKTAMLNAQHLYFDDFGKVLYFFKEIQAVNFELKFTPDDQIKELFQNFYFKVENDIPQLYENEHKVDFSQYFREFNKTTQAHGIPRYKIFDYFNFNRPK